LRQLRSSCVPAALAAACLVAACVPSPPPRPDVLLITVDTLRPDHLGLYGYPRSTTPNIDRWFAPARRFTRAYSTEANTSPSVVSLLSGRYPQDHGVRLLYQLVPDDLVLLTERLPPAYQTAAFVSNIVLTDEAIGLAKRFDHYDDFVADPEPYREIYERNAAKTTDAVLAWLRDGRDAERPLLLWVHYIDPHGPYQPPDDWTFSFAHEGSVPVDRSRIHGYQLEPGLDDGLGYVDRYDEEIAYLDTHVGRLLDGYSERTDADDAWIFFTADHGESMMEHERWFTHGYHVYEEIIRVPLMIRGPGVDAGASERLASGVDLLPTILTAIGAERPDELAGVDLLGGERAPAERTVFAEGSQDRVQIRAAIQRDDKWMAAVGVGSGELKGVRYYDLASDPDELRPRPASAPQPALAELMRRIEADPDPAGRPAEFAKGLQLGAPKVAPRADEQARERLRALGYVE